MEKLIRIIIAALLLVPGLVCGQGLVKGTVSDDGGEPLPAATVQVLSVPDSLPVRALGTDIDGAFSAALPPGSYLLKITYIGYQVHFCPQIRLDGEETDLGIIVLEEDLNALQEVRIARKTPVVEQLGDRMVFNVENTALTAGLNALEVLQRTPGLNVDDEGNISMRGKPGVRVMINGKLSYLSEKELALLLKGMQSSSLKRIELITSPSARFDAAGHAGLINIVMHTETRSGVQGSANMFGAYGRKRRAGAGVNLNIRQRHWNVTGGYDYLDRDEKEYRSFVRSFTGGANSGDDRVSDQYSETFEPLKTHNGKFGIDFSPDERLGIGILWTGNFGRYNNLSEGYNAIAVPGGGLVSDARTNNTHKDRWDTHSLNLNVQKKAGKHEISADFDFTRASYGADQLLRSDFLPVRSQPGLLSVRKGITPSLTRLYVGKIDYLWSPGGGHIVESGWKSSWIDADNNAVNDTLNGESWIRDRLTSNHFLYREQIHALYVNYRLEKERWRVTAGLRAESTRTASDQVTTGEVTRKYYTQLFPSASVSYAPSESHSWKLAYSRRIKRPDYEDLNPFRYYVDAFLFWEGNPYLRPELAHSVELSYTFGDALTFSLYYSRVSDVMTSVLTQLPERNVTIRSVANIALFRNIGLNTSYTLNPAPFWSGMINLNVFNNRYSGRSDSQDISNERWSGTISSMNSFSLGKDWNAELNAEYNSAYADGVFRIRSNGMVSLGLKKKLLSEKLSLKLGVSDVLRTMKYRSYSDVGGVKMQQHFNLDSRVATLSLSYKFGKEIQVRERSSGAGDEQGRIRGGR